jgi:hypothetical protein
VGFFLRHFDREEIASRLETAAAYRLRMRNLPEIEGRALASVASSRPNHEAGAG